MSYRESDKPLYTFNEALVLIHEARCFNDLEMLADVLQEDKYQYTLCELEYLIDEYKIMCDRVIVKKEFGRL